MDNECKNNNSLPQYHHNAPTNIALQLYCEFFFKKHVANQQFFEYLCIVYQYITMLIRYS